MSLPPMPAGLDLSESVVTSNVTVEAVLRAMAFLAVMLRFVARRVGRLNYWWDDWLILALAIALVPGTVIKFWLYSAGLGRHIWWVVENDDATLDTYGKLAFVDLLHYVPAVLLIKLSLLCFYVRVFWVSKPFVWVCYTQMLLVVVWATVSELFYFFQCYPVWLTWSLTRPDGACLSFITTFVGTTTVSVVMDYAILITPLYTVWSLHLSKRKKVLISGILMLGAGECIFSTIRLVRTAQLPFLDVTWDRATMSLWCSSECDIGVLCACIPTFGTLLPKRWMDSTRSSASYSAKGMSRFSNEPNQSMIRSPKVETFFETCSSSDSPIQDEEFGMVARGNVIVRTTEFTIGHERQWRTSQSDRQSYPPAQAVELQ